MGLYIVTEVVEYMYEAECPEFALAMEIQDEHRDRKAVVIDREVREL